MKLGKYIPPVQKRAPIDNSRSWEKRFAFLPIVADGHWIWLESYYVRLVYSWHGAGGYYNWSIEMVSTNPKQISTEYHLHRSIYE